MQPFLGIDIGGTFIKGSLVDTEKLELASERKKLPTPSPATPEAIANTVAELVRHFDYSGPVGVGFPSLIVDNVCLTANNIHKSWIGKDVQKLFSDATGLPFQVINDADAAGIAEIKAVTERKKGTTIFLTLGTGIGSALFHNNCFVPNTELGTVEFKGAMLEKYASNSARERDNLSWTEYGKRLNEALHYLEYLFAPTQFILSGGISNVFDKYKGEIDTRADVSAAKLRNLAGCIGAAMIAENGIEGL